MAGTTLCKFVDSIAASPTVRFDFNGGIVDLQRIGTIIEMPPLRSAWADNAMTDGGFQSSSAYGPRVIRLHALIQGDADTAATSMQTLFRECDRDGNFLLWHPRGASKPVFFKTFRVGPENVDMSEQSVGVWRVQVALLAEPFALGLREDLVTSATVTNNPAAGSNGLYFDTPSVVLGDVATPALIHVNTLAGLTVCVASEPSTGGALPFAQCESGTLGTDTTNPGAGPDAAMSGTGTNNYARTSFATTATMANRVTALGTVGNLTNIQNGRYRAFVRVRRSDASSVMTVRLGISPVTTMAAERYLDTKTLPLSTTPQLIDLGTFDNPAGVDVDRGLGDGGVVPGKYNLDYSLQAARASGTGTLDWDYFLLVPAFNSLLMGVMPTVSTPGNTLIDTATGQVLSTGSGFPSSLDTGNQVGTGASTGQLVGSLPVLLPNRINRIHASILPGAVGATTTWKLSYWPRYLFVRPSAT